MVSSMALENLLIVMVVSILANGLMETSMEKEDK